MAGMFSTKGMYALRAMADLASHDGWVSLGDVSKRQNISRKYLEQVISLMHKAGFVESQRGKGGGERQVVGRDGDERHRQIAHPAAGDRRTSLPPGVVAVDRVGDDDRDGHGVRDHDQHHVDVQHDGNRQQRTV